MPPHLLRLRDWTRFRPLSVLEEDCRLTPFTIVQESGATYLCSCSTLCPPLICIGLEEVERDDVCTASDFSKELLNIIFEQREALD
jgi:hypothetical protein